MSACPSIDGNGDDDVSTTGTSALPCRTVASAAGQAHTQCPGISDPVPDPLPCEQLAPQPCASCTAGANRDCESGAMRRGWVVGIVTKRKGSWRRACKLTLAQRFSMSSS